MPKLGVVEVRICRGGGGFGRWVAAVSRLRLVCCISGRWCGMMRRVSSRVLICALAIMGRGSILLNLEKMPQGAEPDLGDRQVPTSSSVWG